MRSLIFKKTVNFRIALFFKVFDQRLAIANDQMKRFNNNNDDFNFKLDMILLKC